MDATEVVPDVEQILRVENTDYTNLDGNPVKMIVVRMPGDVPLVRDLFETTYESDIPFEQRANIDLGLQHENKNLCYIDIELSTNRLSEISRFGRAPVSIITIKRDDNPYEIMAWHPSVKPSVTTQTILGDECILHLCKTENDMFSQFEGVLKGKRIDAFVEYAFGRSFDIRHIISRSKPLGIDLSSISPIGEIHDKSNRFKGIENIIYGPLYREYHLSGLRDNSLGGVCREEGVGDKYPLPHKQFKTLHLKHFDTLIKYNKRDVELLYNLDQKLKLIDNYTELASLGRTEISYTIPRGVFLEKYCLVKFREAGVVLPNNPSKDMARERFEGAYVMEPITGLHKNIAVIDFDSFYPNIIKMLKVPYIADMIDELSEERQRFKDIMNQYPPESEKYSMYYKKQTQRKFVNNSIYGYMSWMRGRLGKHFLKYSAQVAATAKRNIIDTKMRCEQAGYTVVAGDTDSIFVMMGNKTIDDMHNLTAHLNKTNKDGFTMSLEKIYDKILIRAKKRYAAHVIWEGKATDKMEYKGIEIRRSDSSMAVKEAQNIVLDGVFDEKPRTTIFAELKNYIEELPNKDYIVIGTPTRLNFKRNDYRDKRAKYTNVKYGRNYKTGDKPYMIPTFNQVGGVFIDDDDDMKHIKEQVDYRCIQNILSSKLNKLFEPLGWDIDEFNKYLQSGIHVRQSKL